MFTARGECNIENLACGFRIVEEQFEEIAHPIEQQAVARDLPQGKVLRHHRGRGGGI